MPDDKYVKCKSCDKIIAELINDEMVPTPEECYRNGNVPVPNMGWLCSQECANDLEKKYDIKFARTKEGKVDYYAKR